jgi:hypothetical protein
MHSRKEASGTPNGEAFALSRFSEDVLAMLHVRGSDALPAWLAERAGALLPQARRRVLRVYPGTAARIKDVPGVEAFAVADPARHEAPGAIGSLDTTAFNHSTGLVSSGPLTLSADCSSCARGATNRCADAQTVIPAGMTAFRLAAKLGEDRRGPGEALDERAQELAVEAQLAAIRERLELGRLDLEQLHFRHRDDGGRAARAVAR